MRCRSHLVIPVRPDGATANRRVLRPQIKMFSHPARRSSTAVGMTSTYTCPVLLPANEAREYAAPHEQDGRTDQSDGRRRMDV